jgi:hypothetical protein
VEALSFSSFENLTGVGKGFDRRNTDGDQSRTLGCIVELVDEAGRVIGSGTERAAEALRRAEDDGGSAATGAGGAGGRDAAEETVSAVREGAERASEQARRLMGVSAQDGEAVLAHASRSLDLWVRCGTVFADGAQTLWKEMVSTSRAAVERRMSGLSQATGARTVAEPPPAAAVQPEPGAPWSAAAAAGARVRPPPSAAVRW